MWSGGEASKARLHADYKSALRRDQAPLLGVAYLAKGWPAALTTRRARRSRSQGTELR